MVINWTEIITNIITNTAIPAVMLGVLGFIGKSIIDRWFSHDLESYKTKLQASNAIELEKLRADLKIAAFEHETRFAKLHAERAEIISELYKQMVRMQEKFTNVARMLEPEGERPYEEKMQDALEVASLFVDYFEGNRIYFNEAFCKQIMELLQILAKAQTYFELYQDDITHTNKIPNLWAEACQIINRDVPLARQKIENEFRQMLGLE